MLYSTEFMSFKPSRFLESPGFCQTCWRKSTDRPGGGGRAWGVRKKREGEEEKTRNQRRGSGERGETEEG